MQHRDQNTVILGIESSCDETAAAVFSSHAGILANVVSSQTTIHSEYGGVVPELASREHLRAIVPVVRQALGEAKLSWSSIDGVAVTVGPGLIGALLVGLTYAKAICFARKLPLLAVNHVEGHLYSVLFAHPEMKLPAVALVVSGGHTHLFAVDTEQRYRLLGRTRDDAAGEAYDKVAKLLGFGYPGGPLLDRLAAYGEPGAVPFTRTRVKANAMDLSFSGYKTAVLRWVEGQAGMAEEITQREGNQDSTMEGWLRVTPRRTLDLMASFQAAVVRELLERVEQAAEQIGAESVIVAGGVAANSGLRQQASKRRHLQFYFPGPRLAMDNAAMIAAAGLEKFRRGNWAPLDVDAAASLPLA